MTLFLNKTNHWQLSDGFELRSGDQVEVYLDCEWIPAEINYHPPGQYRIRFEKGKTMEINKNLILRVRNRLKTKHNSRSPERARQADEEGGFQGQE